MTLAVEGEGQAARALLGAESFTDLALRRHLLARVADTDARLVQDVKRVEASALTELVITDSIGAPQAVSEAKKIRRLTIAPLLALAVRRIADESSVSSLFD